jgi:hypothetical protein
MPIPEERNRQLEQFAVVDGEDQLRERVTALPPALATIGLAFWEGITRPWHDGRVPQRTQEKRALGELAAADRLRLFAALFPPIADLVEANWQMQVGQPYQTGLLRKAFRAPNHPEYTLASRIEWLDQLLRALVLYRYDLDFLTVWGGYLRWGSAEHAIGLLLAAALDSGHPARERTRATLTQIANGEHPVAVPARYVVTALLASANPRDWEVVERLLLAAQRQEGLRQVVLESVDFAHRDAFVRMLHVMDREQLCRFAAVARAVAVWFGLPIDSAQTKLIDQLVHETAENLESAPIRGERIRVAKGQELYLALWAQAFLDVTVATELAAGMAGDAEFERRYAAVCLLTQAGTLAAAQALPVWLRDADLRIAMTAAGGLPTYSESSKAINDGHSVFAALQELLERVPEEQTLPPAVWEWNRIKVKRSAVAALLIAFRGELPFAKLAPYLPVMDADGRQSLLRTLQSAVEKHKSIAPDERDLALLLLADPSNAVRERAFSILGSATLTGGEAESIEPLLGRKASDLRRGVIRLLLTQSVADCRASIARLESSGDALMRKAAEEIRHELEPKSVPAVSLVDGLGLFDPAQRTSPVPPRRVIEGKVSTALTTVVLQSLNELVDWNRETPIDYQHPNGETVRELFGNLSWVDPDREFPLGAIWREWRQEVERELGADERQLVQALGVAMLVPERHWAEEAKRTANELIAPIDLGYLHLVRAILWFLVAEGSTVEAVHGILDIFETYLARLLHHYAPAQLRDKFPPTYWRGGCIPLFPVVVDSCRDRRPETWDRELWQRYWRLLRWVDCGMPRDATRHLPPLAVTMAAHQAGVATEADVYEQLIGERGRGGSSFPDLRAITGRKPHQLFATYPILKGFADRCRERILEVELQRGDLPTAASPAALALRSVFGGELALRLLTLLGKDNLARGYVWDNESRAVVFSHLLRVCLPSAEDSPDRFAEAAKRSGILEKRLVELAVYAPQWAAHVEQATGIPGLADAAYWLHAHTKDSQWRVDFEIQELWFAEVSERTPIQRQELLEGAVDVEWFHRVSRTVPPAAWKLVFEAAKFASGGGGHKRAQLFAAAIAGEVTTAELTARIREKRQQDAVRALGLVPLAQGEAARRQDILGRYEILQEYLRESKQFGALRQSSEALAQSIGLANLARTAGYPDPQRLSWAMEAVAIADLRTGRLEVVDGDVKGILAINAAGEPELMFEKNGKALKDLPSAARKSPMLAPLRARRTQLAQQTSRMRLSLEEAMIRGDRFTGKELAELAEHPLLRPMVAALLFVDESGAVDWYAAQRGAEGTVRIAHPVDLLRSGQWPARQRECLEAQRVQPFKQAFRVLYLVTDAERSAKTHSGRYEGNQVNPSQGIALLGKRGWVNVPEEGVRKTFHSDNVSVWVTFLQGWFTPAEVDGLTVQHVVFRGKNDGRDLALDAVNPRIFSEAMRDLDLMVSVAHRGGVDPETTASTVAMRTALLRETFALLKIKNVRFEEPYAFVDGKLSNYNVHLGSGTVHRQPGGSVCLIPVHSQHRGRVFLPFADNDPKTAEIVSKVLLLAQDDKIKDPTISEQLR